VLGELDVLVLPHGHEAEGRQGLALGPRADDDDLGGGVLAGLVDRHHNPRRHVEITELGGDLDVAHPAPSDEGNEATGLPGGVAMTIATQSGIEWATCRNRSRNGPSDRRPGALISRSRVVSSR